MMNLENPGFETIAIAEYITGSCSAEYFLASLSGTGELARKMSRGTGLLLVICFTN